VIGEFDKVTGTAHQYPKLISVARLPIKRFIEFA